MMRELVRSPTSARAEIETGCIIMPHVTIGADATLGGNCLLHPGVQSASASNWVTASSFTQTPVSALTDLAS